MTIGEAGDVAQLLHFLDGTSTGEAARERARDAALRLAQRAGKPLLLTVRVDADELDDALAWLDDVRAGEVAEWGDPADLANRPCPVRGCGQAGCEQPAAAVRGRWVHVQDVAVAGGRL